jgi:acyl-CoA thioesterase I
MKLHIVFTVLVSVLTASEAQVSTPVKWACIGNSITQGTSSTTAYPARVAKFLGTSYTVENDGVPSMTLLKSGKFGATTDAPGSGSYWIHGKLANVFALKPDIITISLGTNDAKSISWQDSANFVRDYTALIDTLSGISSRPQIWLVLPCPCWITTTGPADIQNSVIKNSIIPKIKQVAAAKGLGTIDFNAPMINLQSHFPDNIHPDSVGADSLARIMYHTYAATCVRICCIGNSITQYGSSSDVPDIDAYPSKLGMLLGRGYLVQNDGVSGCAMQKKNAGWSYWDTGAKKFPLIFGFKPNVITIKLGTNDSRRYWWHTTAYITDYEAMIDTLNNNISPKPTIKLCLPIPAYPSGFVKYGINDTIIRDSVIPAIKVAAQAKGLAIIDLNTPMQNTLGTLVPADDGVHPNAAGQDTLAHLIYRNLSLSTATMDPGTAPFGDNRSRAVASEIRVAKSGAVVVSLVNHGTFTVTVAAINGTVRAKRTFTGKEMWVMPMLSTPAGIYIVRVSSGSQTVAQKVVVAAR